MNGSRPKRLGQISTSRVMKSYYLDPEFRVEQLKPEHSTGTHVVYFRIPRRTGTQQRAVEFPLFSISHDPSGNISYQAHFDASIPERALVKTSVVEENEEERKHAMLIRIEYHDRTHMKFWTIELDKAERGIDLRLNKSAVSLRGEQTLIGAVSLRYGRGELGAATVDA